LQKESDDSDPVSMGWTLVAGADLEEGKGIRMLGAVLYKIANMMILTRTKYFHAERPKEAVAIVAFSGLMWTIDAIGEITLTTKGKDSDPPPQLQLFQEMPRC
jgi:hypothetical protein